MLEASYDVPHSPSEFLSLNNQSALLLQLDPSVKYDCYFVPKLRFGEVELHHHASLRNLPLKQRHFEEASFQWANRLKIFTGWSKRCFMLYLKFYVSLNLANVADQLSSQNSRRQS